MTYAPDRLHQVELTTAAPVDSGVYYEWLLGLAPASRPGQALERIGIAGVHAPAPQQARTGWIPVFTVDSIDDAVARVEPLGGIHRSIPDADGNVRDYIVNPTGTWTRIIAAESVTSDSPRIGHRANVDYSAMDLDQDHQFFQTLLQVPALTIPDDLYDMRLLYEGKSAATGILKLHGLAGVSRQPNWFIYFEVDDIATHIARAVGSGSLVRIPPSASPFNTYTILSDPWGQMFGFSTLGTPEQIEQVMVTDAEGSHGSLADFLTL